MSLGAGEEGSSEAQRPASGVLITFGAWHASWFEEQLALRDDVRVIPLREAVDSAGLPGSGAAARR